MHFQTRTIILKYLSLKYFRKRQICPQWVSYLWLNGKSEEPQYVVVAIFPPGVEDVQHPGAGALPGLQQVLPGPALQLPHAGPEDGAGLRVLAGLLRALSHWAERHDDLRDSLGDVGLHDFLLRQNRKLRSVFRRLLVTGELVHETNLKENQLKIALLRRAALQIQMFKAFKLGFWVDPYQFNYCWEEEFDVRDTTTALLWCSPEGHSRPSSLCPPPVPVSSWCSPEHSPELCCSPGQLGRAQLWWISGQYHWRLQGLPSLECPCYSFCLWRPHEKRKGYHKTWQSSGLNTEGRLSSVYKWTISLFTLYLIVIERVPRWSRLPLQLFAHDPTRPLLVFQPDLSL